MHDAYEVAQLLKLTVQIESIAAYGDNLLVGTKQGHLLMYSVSRQHGDQKHDVQLLRYNKNFSKKPIQQLDVVPEYQMLISLSDNIICVHDMTIINFPTITTVHRTRGATLFTLDIKRQTTLTGETSITVRMCVAVRRRLQLFYWKNGSFLDLREDLCVPDIPKALAWCKETICVGFKGDYILLELSGKTNELFPTGKYPEPSITKLTDSVFALGKDNQSIFMNTECQPTHKYAVKWSEVPIALAYDEPYLLAVLTDAVEIRTVEPYLNIQCIKLTKPKLICRCKQGQVYVASLTYVWCLQLIPVSQQIRLLLDEKQFQLALKLTNISEETPDEKEKSIYQIQTLYAFDLFYNRQFHESMKEFIKLKTDPYEVIRLFPDLLPQQHQANDSKPPLKLQGRDLENGLLALIEFLTEVRRNVIGDTKNTKSPRHVNSSSSKKTIDQLLQIIDTTLLKCYLQTNDALVAPLLRLNHCHLQETEKTLKKFQKFSELIILYQTKGLHQKALELLQKQSEGPDCSHQGHDRTVQYLQHLGREHIDLIFKFASWILEAHPDDGLKIFTEDIQEVEQLPRPKVLDYLLRTQKLLVIPYLEHVVHVWEDTNPIFHNALVHQYQEQVQQLMEGKEEKVPPAISAGKETGELGRIRSKLICFLEKSSHYTPETVLVQFPYNCLFEERAIVLGKLGRHEQALSIYISVLQDVDQGARYCEKVYQDHGEGSDEVYVILMKMLIKPPENWLVGVQRTPAPPPDLEAALQLLEKHASKIHPVHALTILPDSVPLGRIRHFLEASLQQKLNERRKTQVLKGLLHAENLQLQDQRICYESQSIIMTEFNVCPVCKKKFGNQSAFARYPNGDIVHYSCQDRRS